MPRPMRRRFSAQSGAEFRARLGGEGEEFGSPLHEERLDAVTDCIRASGARSVLDLGCGSGALLGRLLAEKQFTRIVGIDTSFEGLVLAERLKDTSPGQPERLSLRHGSFTDSDEGLTGFDAAAMVETIEHIPPAHLSRVERAVFSRMRPRLVVMTTPNRDYNERYGIAGDELRHVDHRFEWGRTKFEGWARGLAGRTGYDVTFQSIGPADAWLGGPTQMAVFSGSTVDFESAP
jgi:small RNA 2'-O-methyltransferase